MCSLVIYIKNFVNKILFNRKDHHYKESLFITESVTLRINLVFLERMEGITDIRVLVITHFNFPSPLSWRCISKLTSRPSKEKKGENK
jgi:hypothetical protein